MDFLYRTATLINISCKCDTNRAGHFTLDAYASRPVACPPLSARLVNSCVLVGTGPWQLLHHFTLGPLGLPGLLGFLSLEVKLISHYVSFWYGVTWFLSPSGFGPGSLKDVTLEIRKNLKWLFTNFRGNVILVFGITEKKKQFFVWNLRRAFERLCRTGYWIPHIKSAEKIILLFSEIYKFCHWSYEVCLGMLDKNTNLSGFFFFFYWEN